MLLMPDENKNNVVDVEKIKNSVVQVGHGAKNVILPAWSPIEYEIFPSIFIRPQSDHCLALSVTALSHSVSALF